MNIKTDTTVLEGQWVMRKGEPIADAVCKQINTLTDTFFIKLGHDSSGWLTLYRNPENGSLWELDYPQSEMHGGGPPRLKLISSEEARSKYGDIVIG